MKPKNNIKTWAEQANEYEKNSFWIQKSQRLALKILMHMKREKITQVELADKLGVKPQQVNKIVKGGVNLTLETICKIERELKTEFLVIPEPVKWSEIEQTSYKAFGVTYFDKNFDGYGDDSDIFDQINYLKSSNKTGKIIPIHSAIAKEHATTAAIPNIGPEKFMPIKSKKVS